MISNNYKISSRRNQDFSDNQPMGLSFFQFRGSCRRPFNGWWLVILLSFCFLAACKQSRRGPLPPPDYSSNQNPPVISSKHENSGLYLSRESFEETGFLQIRLPELTDRESTYYFVQACSLSDGSCTEIRSFEGEMSLPFPASGSGQLIVRVCQTGPSGLCGPPVVSPYPGETGEPSSLDSSATLSRLFQINYKLRDLLFQEGLYLYRQHLRCHPENSVNTEMFFNSILSEPVDSIAEMITAMGGEDQDYSRFSLPVPPDNYRAIILPDQRILKDSSELLPAAFGLTSEKEDEEKTDEEKTEKEKQEEREEEIMEALDTTRVLASIGIGFVFNFVYAASLIRRMDHWKAWTESQKKVTLYGTEFPVTKVSGRKNLFQADLGNGKHAYYLRDINKKMITPPYSIGTKKPDIQMRGNGMIEELDPVTGKVKDSWLPQRKTLSNGMLGEVDLSGSKIQPLRGVDPTEHRMKTMLERHKADPGIDSYLGGKYGTKYRKGYILASASLATLNAALLVYALSNYMTDKDPDEQFFQMTMAISVLNLAYNLVDVWDGLKTRSQWLEIKRNSPPDLGITRKALSENPVSLRRQVESTKYVPDDVFSKAGTVDQLKYRANQAAESVSGPGKGRIMLGTVFVLTSLAGIILSANELEKFNLTDTQDKDSPCLPPDPEQFLAHMINVRNLRLELVTNTGQIMQALGE